MLNKLEVILDNPWAYLLAVVTVGIWAFTAGFIAGMIIV